MHREFLMGNEAMALGALAAGVDVVAGYPGTPSTEIIETVAKRNPGDVYVEWSVNEKAALEVAAGASYAGARSLVTMKCVGLNVAADPLMSLEYIGVKGGMVIVVADDPGPISSQTEQDTRTFAQFSKVPCP
jgi:indolepyruvate ferredoxin oxidoreductase alpha subunit